MMQQMTPQEFVDRDCLLLAIERSMRVRAHAHFFNWTQGALQALLPHDILLCTAYDAQGNQVHSDVLGAVPIKEDVRSMIVRPDGGLIAGLRAMWEHNGRQPLAVRSRNVVVGPEHPVAVMLETLAFSNVVVHGSATVNGAVDAFFGFVGVREDMEDAFTSLVDLILPHLRAALLRIQVRKKSTDNRPRGRALTVRERQILQLLEHGSSNAEIGAALSISPLTVKNHVQKMYRKLGVHNRTQAVALDIGKRWLDRN